MHAFDRYYNGLNKADKKENTRLKKNFLSKYYPWIAQIFVTIENLINSIDAPVCKSLTDYEVAVLGKILTEMYSHDPETEIESMLVAVTELTKLQVKIWKRLNRANERFWGPK